MPGRKPMPRRKPDLSIPAEDIQAVEPEAKPEEPPVGDDVWGQIEYAPDTVPFAAFTDVRIVEYLVESLDVRSQAVNDARRERVAAEIRDLLADGYTLLSSAGGAHGNRTLFVFTLAK